MTTMLYPTPNKKSAWKPTEDRMRNRDFVAVGLNEYLFVQQKLLAMYAFYCYRKRLGSKTIQRSRLLDLTKTRSCEGDGRFGGSSIGKDYWWYKYKSRS